MNYEEELEANDVSTVLEVPSPGTPSIGFVVAAATGPQNNTIWNLNIVYNPGQDPALLATAILRVESGTSVRYWHLVSKENLGAQVVKLGFRVYLHDLGVSEEAEDDKSTGKGRIIITQRVAAGSSQVVDYPTLPDPFFVPL